MFGELKQYPAIREALLETCGNTFRGNTFGQHGVYNVITPEMRERASRFDVHAALEKAVAEREQFISSK